MARILSQTAAELETIHLGQDGLEQDQVGGEGIRQRQGLLAIARHRDFIAGPAQEEIEGDDDVFITVDHEDFLRHLPSLTCF